MPIYIGAYMIIYTLIGKDKMLLTTRAPAVQTNQIQSFSQHKTFVNTTFVEISLQKG